MRIRFLLVLLSILSSNVRAQTWHAAGSIPDSVTAVCGNGMTGNLLAGTPRGIYVSSDTGKSWIRPSQPSDVHITVLLALPNGNVLCGTSSGLFIGPDMGPWTATNVTSPVTAISRNGTVGTQDGKILQPDNTYNSWIQGAIAQGAIIAFGQSLVGQRFDAITSAGQVWTNGGFGSQWVNSPPPSGARVVGTTIIWVGSSDTTLLATYDSGIVIWGGTPFNAGLPTRHMLAMAGSSDGQNVLVASDSGVFEFPAIVTNTTLDNLHWLSISSGLPLPLSLAAFAPDGSSLALKDNRIFTMWTTGTYRRVMNTKSNLRFYVTNDGRPFFANNFNDEGLFWPRDSNDSYIFGAGLWVAAKKVIGGKLRKLCELTYNPNTGGSWFRPGEIGATSDGADTNWKYFPYLSTSFSTINGSPTAHDANTPLYRWPMWGGGSNALKTNFNFGTHMSSVIRRDSLASLGMPPAVLSDEDIVNDYTDTPPVNNPEFKPNAGYPFGLNIHESIYTWGYGRYRDVIYLRYDVTNQSSDTLFDCWLAPAFDPDLGAADGGAGNDFNSYVSDAVAQANANAIDLAQLPEPYRSHPSALNMVYQYRNAKVWGKPYGMIGFSLVESPVIDMNGRIIPNDDSAALNGYGPKSKFTANQEGLVTFRSWTISKDPPTEDLRYDFCSGGTKDLAAMTANDQRILMATGPFTLLPGQHATTTVAIGIARPSTTDAKTNFGGLLQLMAFANQFFATNTTDPLDSNSVTVHHFGMGLPQAVHGTILPVGIKVEWYPNPSNGTANLRLILPRDMTISINLVDATGRTIMEAVKSRAFAIGEQIIPLDLSTLPSGSYFARVIANGEERIVGDAAAASVPISVEH